MVLFSTHLFANHAWHHKLPAWRVLNYYYIYIININININIIIIIRDMILQQSIITQMVLHLQYMVAASKAHHRSALGSADEFWKSINCYIKSIINGGK